MTCHDMGDTNSSRTTDVFLIQFCLAALNPIQMVRREEDACIAIAKAFPKLQSLLGTNLFLHTGGVISYSDEYQTLNMSLYLIECVFLLQHRSLTW